MLIRLTLLDPRAGRHGVGEPDITAYPGALSDGYSPKDRGAGIYYDIIFNDRMPRYALYRVSRLVKREAFCPQGDPLIDPHVVADNRRLADYRTGAVIDKQRFADPRARMNVDAGIRMGHF